MIKVQLREQGENILFADEVKMADEMVIAFLSFNKVYIAIKDQDLDYSFRSLDGVCSAVGYHKTLYALLKSALGTLNPEESSGVFIFNSYKSFGKWLAKL